MQDSKNGNWVYGVFEEGNMKDMLDFSNENPDDYFKKDMILEKIREKERKYFNTLFDEPEFSYLDGEI